MFSRIRTPPEPWDAWPGILPHVQPCWDRAAIGYNRFGNLNESVYVDQDWPAKIGLLNVPGTHFPVLTFAGHPYQGGGIGAGGRLGSNNRGGSYNGSTIGQVDMTYVHGKHNIKFGSENRLYYYNTRNLSLVRATSISRPIRRRSPVSLIRPATASPVSCWAPMPVPAALCHRSNFGYRWRDYGFYVQDDWKISRKLTLNIGLRWEIIGGLFEVAGRISQIDFSKPNALAGNRPGALAFVDDLGKRGPGDPYYGQLSPKLGFAYAMNTKLVLRGGYGINNTPPISNGFGFGGTLGFNGSINLNSANIPIRFAEDVLGYIQNPYPSFTGVLPNKSATQANGQILTFYNNIYNHMPYVQNWNFGFQYQLPAASVIEVNYIGNKGTHLMARGIPIQRVALQRDATVRRSSAAPLERIQPDSAALPWLHRDESAGPASVSPVHRDLGPVPQCRQFQFSIATGPGDPPFQERSGPPRRLHVLETIGMADNALDSESIADQFNRRLDRSIINYDYPHFVK